jgi:hypothetical protein
MASHGEKPSANLEWPHIEQAIVIILCGYELEWVNCGTVFECIQEVQIAVV